MKQIFLWFVLLNKRLARRISFWLILAAVPLLVLALGLLAQQESGVATVAVYVEDETDPAATSMLERLRKEKSVIHYRFCDSEQEARSLVKTSRADVAWILPDDLSARIDARAGGKDNAIVRVCVREGDDILQMLVREKLFAAIYPELAYDVYTRYVADTLKPSPMPSDEELNEYYHSIERGDRLIELSFLDGTADTDTSYLVMPVRGLMALMVMMAALASALYYLHDARADSFVWLSRRRKRIFPYAYHLIPVLDTAAVMFLTLFLAKLNVAWYKELALIVLYMLACAAFAELMRQLFKSTTQLGVAIPILMLAMLALSPIFFELKQWLRYLFPPFYYLNGTHSPIYILLLAVYTLVVFALGLAVGRVRERFEKE